MGAGATHWLLIRGRGERPLPAHVDAAAIGAHGSSRRPSVQPGELCILYAAVWQAIFGVVEVVGVRVDFLGGPRDSETETRSVEVMPFEAAATA